jgi:MFS family permease
MHRADSWKSKLIQIPFTIWMLGFVSLLMNISSVMITILTPIFITTVLGATYTMAATIDGIVEALSSFLKVFSGTLSDKLKKRKFLIVIGYGVGVLVKPLFAMAQSVTWIFTARVIDRLSNGMRDTPRDALMADSAPAHIKGKCFGLRIAMGSVGSLIGAGITFLLMWLWAMDFRTVFWISLIPSTMALILLIFFIKDKHSTPDIQISAGPEFHLSEIKSLSKSFWYLILIAFIFMLGKTSESLLVLRTFQIVKSDVTLGSWLVSSNENMGANIGLVCGVMILMNLVYSSSAYPMGRVSDKFDRRIFLFLGGSVLIGANLLLAFSTTTLSVALGVALWGLHMGIVQGLFASMIAERAPAHLKGTAFGAFHLVSGLAAIIGVPTSGYIWQNYGAEYSFLAEVCAVGIALIFAIFLPKYKEKSSYAS